jgi:hypothetical protein
MYLPTNAGGWGGRLLDEGEPPKRRVGSGWIPEAEARQDHRLRQPPAMAYRGLAIALRRQLRLSAALSRVWSIRLVPLAEAAPGFCLSVA